MFESLSGFFSAAFASKWAFLAGGLLVSSPIIIHLINRMRFKRIRWAAMEFLLKAQKKVKRKMVVEQLLLLILRILLMVLIGLLIARFSGFDLAGKDNRTTQHFVLIDDSPSMADKWKPAPDQPEADGLEQARRVLVDQIVPAAAKAPTAQFLDVALTSRPDAVRPFGQVGNDTSADGGSLNVYLKSLTAGTVRPDLAAVLRSAKMTLQKQSGPDKAQVLYVMSDLRANDWAEQGEAAKLELDELKKAGVLVHLVDVVGEPFRRADLRAPRGNDNIGIVDLVPGKPVVARGEAVEFTLKVRNYGVAPVENARFAIKINGDDNKGRSVAFASLPAGQVTQERFELTFDEIGTDPRLLPTADSILTGSDKDAEGLFKRFSLVTASLDTVERGGIPADNVRHAVVEVRDKLPVLVVDGGKADVRPGEEGAGEFKFLKEYFRTASAGGSGFVVSETTAEKLAQTDLTKFSLLLLLDVEKLSETAAKNVEAFVKNGGGCGVFLGGKVRPQEYNKFLYKDGAGFFPVPLPDAPTPKPTDEQLFAQQLKGLFQQKFLLRESKAREHPALSGLYQNERGLPLKPAEEVVRWSQYITIKQYFKIARDGKWRDDKNTTELFCLPNESELKEYTDAIAGVREKIAAAVGEPDLAKFRKPVGDVMEAMRQALINDGGLGTLAIQFDRLLCDGRSEGDPNEAILREFWALPAVADLRGEVARLRDRVKFGDPIYLAKQFGRGRVTVFLSSADDAWTDWPSSQPANYCYLPIVREMVTYLSGGGGDSGLACGQTIRFDLPAIPDAKDGPLGYRPKVRKAFVTTNPKPGERNNNAIKVDFADFGAADLPTENGLLAVAHEGLAKDAQPGTVKPGVYFFGLVQSRPGGEKDKRDEAADFRAVVVNLDSREGDLRRVTTDDLAQHATGLTVHAPDDPAWTDALQNKKSDLSEAGWIFLIAVVVLVCEQALATRLSQKGADDAVAKHAPSADEAVRRRAAPAPTDATAA